VTVTVNRCACFFANKLYLHNHHPSSIHNLHHHYPSHQLTLHQLSRTKQPDGPYEINEHIITGKKRQEYTAKMGLLHGAEMTASYILHSVFRLIQMIMALAVCGLYGVDLNKANREHKYSDGKWVCLPSFSSPSPSLFEPKN
jgi:hypothetical protein